MKRACSPDGPPAKRRPGQFTLRQQACRGFLKTYVREGELTDITKFVTQIFPELVDVMAWELEEHQYKAVLVFHVEMVKELVEGHVKKEEAYFRSHPMAVLHSSDIPDAIRDAHSQVSPYATWFLSIVLVPTYFRVLVHLLCRSWQRWTSTPRRDQGGRLAASSTFIFTSPGMSHSMGLPTYHYQIIWPTRRRS